MIRKNTESRWITKIWQILKIRIFRSESRRVGEVLYLLFSPWFPRDMLRSPWEPRYKKKLWFGPPKPRTVDMTGLGEEYPRNALVVSHFHRFKTARWLWSEHRGHLQWPLANLLKCTMVSSICIRVYYMYSNCDIKICILRDGSKIWNWQTGWFPWG